MIGEARIVNVTAITSLGRKDTVTIIFLGDNSTNVTTNQGKRIATPIAMPIKREYTKFPEGFDANKTTLYLEFYKGSKDGLVKMELFFQEKTQKKYKISLLNNNNSPVTGDILVENGKKYFVQDNIGAPSIVKIYYEG